MFTNITAAYNNGDVLIEAACLSTDTKPTDGIANGSACIEMDTGDKYMFDEAGGQWIKLGSGGGGGGDAEVWLTGNVAHTTEEVTEFSLNNVDETDHKAELFTNPANYDIYLNGEALPYLIQGEFIIWADSDDESQITKLVQVYDNGESIDAQALYVIGAEVPDSVEVSVKAK